MPADLARTIDAIFFDYDGVVVESVAVKTRAFGQLFEEFGDTVVAEVLAFHTANLGMSRYAKFEHFYANILQLPLSDDEVVTLDTRLTALIEAGMRDVVLVRGCEEFLTRHCPPIPAYVVSATPQRDITLDVTQRGLDGHFVAAFGSPTSKADHIATVMKTESLDPARCVMVGDARADLQAARANGIAFVGRRGDGEPDVFGTDAAVVITDLVSLEEAIVRAVGTHAAP